MKFLIVNFTGLGNTVLINPVINIIKKNIKDSKISIISNNVDSDLELSNLNKDIDYTINYKQTNLFGKIVFFKDLIVGKYDFIVLNSFSNPSLIFLIYLLFVSNSNIVLPCYLKSLNKKKKKLFNILKIYRQFFFKKKKLIISEPIHSTTHEIDANIAIIKKIFPKNIQINDSYKFNSISLNYETDILSRFNIEKKKYICVQFSGAHGLKSPKIWNSKKSIELIEKLSNFQTVVVIGNNRDNNSKNYHFSQNMNILDLVGKTSLKETVSLLKFSLSNICYDSGIMHLCDAMGVRSINIIGPSNIDKIKPRNEFSDIIHEKVSCSPCLIGWYFDPKSISELQAYNQCKENFKCMELISIEKVINLVKHNYEKN